MYNLAAYTNNKAMQAAECGQNGSAVILILWFVQRNYGSLHFGQYQMNGDSVQWCPMDSWVNVMSAPHVH